jgi:hypothetical protein
MDQEFGLTYPLAKAATMIGKTPDEFFHDCLNGDYPIVAFNEWAEEMLEVDPMAYRSLLFKPQATEDAIFRIPERLKIFHKHSSVPTQKITREDLRVPHSSMIPALKAKPRLFAHSPDYRSVTIDNNHYDLDDTMSKVVAVLHKYTKIGDGFIHKGKLLEELGYSTNTRIDKTIKAHESFGDLIVDEGRYKPRFRLNI